MERSMERSMEGSMERSMERSMECSMERLSRTGTDPPVHTHLPTPAASFAPEKLALAFRVKRAV